MPVTLDHLLAELTPAQRAKVEARAKVLIAEEMSLADLRKAFEKTQASLAKRLKIRQDGVSKIEGRADMLISTLRQFIGGLGGELKLVASFDNRDPVEISGLADLSNRARPAQKRRSVRVA